jgi:hypothetical protein
MAKPFMLVLAAVVSLHAHVTVLNRFPARSSEIEVLNISDGQDAVVAEGKVRSPHADILRVGRRVALYEPPIAVAAVFADGTTRGDAVLVSSLLSRRGSLLQAIDLAREMLSNAGVHNVPRNQLIQHFRLLADSVSRWYLPPH